MRYGSAGGSSRRELLTTLAVTVTACHLTSVADASEAEASTEHPMPHVVLLGDSIFDNTAYVAGGPDVAWQLRERLPEAGCLAPPERRGQARSFRLLVRGMRQEPKNSVNCVIFKRTVAPVAIGPAVTHVFIAKQSFQWSEKFFQFRCRSRLRCAHLSKTTIHSSPDDQCILD